MSISCGSQVVFCDLPVRIDSYNGCTHGCKYCFSQRKTNISIVKTINCITSLKKFVSGERNKETNWCDWNIPLHWGGVSDPFQPLEKKYKISFEILKILSEFQYPFVFSTKGILSISPDYLSLISKSKCVAQISMVCSKYNILENGAPQYDDRLKMCEVFSKAGKRVIVRIQPFMPEILWDVLQNIPRLKNAGVYGVVVEGMKFFSKKPGLVKERGDYCYPENVLKSCFQKIKETCHSNNIVFYSGENRLRLMGDSLCCCGIDGLDGFKGNSFNIMHLKAHEKTYPTNKMREIGTAQCFRAIQQESTYDEYYKKNSFFTVMMQEYKKRNGYK